MIYLFDRDRPSYVIPLTISCILHLLIALMVVILPMRMPHEPRETVIEVFPESPDQIPPPAKDALRIADIDEPAVQDRPAKAKFAGLYDSSVKEEMVGSGALKGSGGKGRGAGADKARAVEKTKTKTDSRIHAKDKLTAVDPDLFAMREPATTRTSREETKTTSVGRVSVGGGSSGDYFPDVKRGEHTYLNVLRYPEVSYFVRLKRAFRTTFNPVPPLQNYFSVNQVARGSIEVILAVGVDESGSLAELFVLSGSGIPGYDHEAMRTVRASSPFSKPPEKFLASDGVLRMMWTFTVYL